MAYWPDGTDEWELNAYTFIRTALCGYQFQTYHTTINGLMQAQTWRSFFYFCACVWINIHRHTTSCLRLGPDLSSQILFFFFARRFEIICIPYITTTFYGLLAQTYRLRSLSYFCAWVWNKPTFSPCQQKKQPETVPTLTNCQWTSELSTKSVQISQEHQYTSPWKASNTHQSLYTSPAYTRSP